MKINLHSSYKWDFTIEYCVKNILNNPNIFLDEDQFEYEFETGNFSYYYASNCADEIFSTIKPKHNWVFRNWGFDGRSGGWFVLYCDGDSSQVLPEELDAIEAIIKEYVKNLPDQINKFYGKK